ncbi:hypothetical protein [Streptococcus moroccensis]|uniref:Beta-carotene 15,15'-monooxygenase n=1 Tax=Streptococcus moroccensis TaxID=1451356 RepID=A0ABT9YWN5_9STRE|nr:hypothetical protein [Streptococcus moroccensis]MDQ0223475.1 hypothetical protein [Streptococcus moroccensis]
MNIGKNSIFLKFFVLLLIALLSITFIADSEVVKNVNQYTVENLDEKKAKVTTLALTATATATAISATPGDATTPLANQIMDITDYLIIILIAIWFQKYLIGFTSIIGFKILIPLVCVLLAGNLFFKKDIINRVAQKMLLFSALIILIIPTSISISNQIEKTQKDLITYQNNEKLVDDKKEKKEKDEGFIDSITSTFENLSDSVNETISSTIEKGENYLNQTMDTIAVFIVTTCLIPIFVIISFIWFANLILGTNLNLKLTSFKSVSRLKK